MHSLFRLSSQSVSPTTMLHAHLSFLLQAGYAKTMKNVKTIQPVLVLAPTYNIQFLAEIGVENIVTQTALAQSELSENYQNTTHTLVVRTNSEPE